MDADSGTINVLHVDDDPEFAELAAEFLQHEDDQLVVDTLTEASDAPETLAAGEYDCVVSDFDMPGQDGIELLDTVREEYPDIPYILYTGKGSEEIASEAISAGVTDYLQKEPGAERYEILANRIRHAVEGNRAQQAVEESERQLRQVYDRITDGFFVVNSDWEYVLVNEEGVRLTDRSEDELLGETVWEAFPELVGTPFEDALRNAMEYQETTTVEGYYPPLDTWFEVRVYGAEDGISIYFQDVTERKLREQELQRSQDLIQALSTTFPDYTFIYSADGEYLDVITGWSGGPDLYSVEQLVGQTVGDILNEAAAKRVQAAIDAALETDVLQTVEYRIETPGGDYWYEGNVAPLPDGYEGQQAVVLSARDITDRKARQEQLKRYQTLVETVGDPMYVLDPEGYIEMANESMIKNLGAIPDDVQGAHISEFMSAGDYDRGTAVIRELLADPERSWETFEMTAVTPAGEEIPAETNIAVLTDEDGSFLGSVGVVRDISDRKRQQEALENRERVLRELYDVMADQERPFAEQVQSLLALGRDELDTKYGTLSEIQGEDYRFEIVDAADDSIEEGDVVPVGATNCEIAARNRQTLVLGDVTRDAPEQTHRAGYADWGIECYIGAPVIVDGEVYGTFCFYDTDPREDQFTDWEVTVVDLMARWVSYEMDRRMANERLRRQNEKLEEFASIVSHDLRNPLNVAKGRLELARESGDTEDLTAVARAHDRMESLIEDLLTYAQQPDDIGEVNEVELGRMAERCWQNIVTDEATLEVESSRTIQADASRLQQLMENLIGNAVEHGGENVTVTIGDLDDGFFIADDGPGIPAADREKIFEAGYSTAAEGAGFGLSIVKEISDAHGWTITVTESGSGGARFEFTDLEPK